MIEAEKGVTYFWDVGEISSTRCAKAGTQAGGRAMTCRSLRTILASTGFAVGAGDGYRLHLPRHIKADLCLSSIAGGTDIVGLFAGGDPTGKVWRGEIQRRCLGMAVEILDEDGTSLRQEKGELCCTKPFPSMPVLFLER